MEVKQRVALEN